METEWLKPKEVAEKLGISNDLLSHWRRQKIGPPFLALHGTRSVRYREEDVTEWIEANITHPQK